jgi:hypothetical protein
MPKDHQPEPRRRGDRIIIFFAAMHVSAIGPKRTSLVAPHMSAFGGKADMVLLRESAIAVAIGGKADLPFCTAYVR